MCRSIKTLRGEDYDVDDLEAAARQFVRKLSGYREPSQANRAVFERAVVEIAESAQRMMDGLVTRAAS